jgi:O-antigen/teichoic acid export membrane protein
MFSRNRPKHTLLAFCTAQLRGKLGRDAGLSIGVHGAYLVITLAVGVILARRLGPLEYGAWAAAFAVLSILVVVGDLGLPNAVTRRVASYIAMRDPSRARAVASGAIWATAIASSIIAVTGVALAVVLDPPGSAMPRQVMDLALISLPCMTVTYVTCNALRGFGRGIFAQIATNIVRPAVILVVIGGISVLIPAKSLHATDAMAANLGAALLTLLTAWWFLRNEFRRARAGRSANGLELDIWREALPFLTMSVLLIVGTRIDLLLITALIGIRSAGLYEVATKCADLVMVPLTATTVVLAPEIARRYSVGDHSSLQRLATLYCRGLFLASLPIGIGLVLFGEPIISALFGHSYTGAARPLAALSVGYLTTLAMGPVYMVLGMTGHSVASAMGAFVTLVFSVVLSLALIPPLGIEGAGLARGLSQTLGAAWLAWHTRRRTGVATTLFAQLPSASVRS